MNTKPQTPPKPRPALENLTREQLLALKLEYQEDINKIKSQLEEAKAKRFTTGVYADVDWFRRTQHALRTKQLLIQKIQYILGAPRNDKPFSEYFFHTAKKVLSEPLFEEIKRAAEIERQEEQPHEVHDPEIHG